MINLKEIEQRKDDFIKETDECMMSSNAVIFEVEKDMIKIKAKARENIRILGELL